MNIFTLIGNLIVPGIIGIIGIGLIFIGMIPFLGRLKIAGFLTILVGVLYYLIEVNFENWLIAIPISIVLGTIAGIIIMLVFITLFIKK